VGQIYRIAQEARNKPKLQGAAPDFTVFLTISMN